MPMMKNAAAAAVVTMIVKVQNGRNILTRFVPCTAEFSFGHDTSRNSAKNGQAAF